MSELMLQRSLSTSSLIKQAAAAVQAQQHNGDGRMLRPRMERAATDYVAIPLSSRRLSPGNNSLFQSSSSSGVMSPSVERKHIHFNEQVEQCIAVEARGEDEEEPAPASFDYDSDSDDGAIMMKRTVVKKKRPLLRRKSSSGYHAESKTIAMLPSTTLKSREDSPGPSDQNSAMKHSYRSPVISPSSSQETLRPSKAAKLRIVDSDEDDSDDGSSEEDEALEMGRRSSTPRPTSADTERSGGLRRTTSSSGLGSEPAGMRRTESGMFMPYEEGEPAAANGGIVGRVIDTVNTARDIAHVIWNVGWRK
jgi:hypothetical protein